MNTLPKTSDSSPQDEFCKGDLNQVWNIVNGYFNTGLVKSIIHNNSSTNEYIEDLMAETMLSMVSHLKENSSEFCADHLETKEYLDQLFEEKRKEVNKLLRKKTSPFDESYMGNEKSEENHVLEENGPSDEDLFTENYFFARSLSPIEEIIFYVKFEKEWKGKVNITHLITLLLNMNSLTNFTLQKQLSKKSTLSLPIIKSWFSQILEKSFLTKPENTPQKWEAFCNSFDTFVDAKTLDEIRKETFMFKRKLSNFGRIIIQMRKYHWTSMEMYFFILHEYLRVENLVEIWFQIRKGSEENDELQKELKAKKLLINKMSFHKMDYEWRMNRLTGSLKLGKKEILKIQEQMKEVQNSIDKKINQYLIDKNGNTSDIENKDKLLFKSINWKTY